MKTQTLTAWLVAAVSTLVIASASYGQNALGDGRKLDNNLQQGSGGVNSPQPDQRIQYGAYQDAIVTGNVTGLSRFRGDIDYRAPGEFTGRLSDRSTYDFELRSLPGVAINDYQRQQLGQVSGQYVSPYQQQAAIALRGGSGVTLADITGQGRQTGVAGSLMLRDDVTQLGVTNAIAAPTLTSTVLSPRTNTVGLTVDQSGNVMRLTATPLAGVRPVPLGDQLQSTLVPRPTTPAAGAEKPAADGTVPLVDPRVEGVPDPADADEPAATDEPGAANPAPLLPDTRLDDQNRTDRPKPIDDRLAVKRVEPTGARSAPLAAGSVNWRDAKPGEDVYFDILRRMDELRTTDRDAVRPAQGNAVVNQGQTPDREPGTEVNRLVERPKPADADADAPKPDAPAAAEDDQVVDRLLAQVNGKNKPVDTLTGNGDTAFDHALADAEQLMKDGEYFKAEDAYVTAMRLKPGHPMAMTGRIHAQLGAGLNLSAATNLRTLLTQHPELIAVRYAGPLMPSKDRMNEVMDRLTRSVAASNRPELPMLVAYIGYQTGNRELVDRGLKAANERRPNDRLIGVLSRVWTQGKPITPAAGPADGVDAPAPALPQPPKGLPAPTPGAADAPAPGDEPAADPAPATESDAAEPAK